MKAAPRVFVQKVEGIGLAFLTNDYGREPYINASLRCRDCEEWKLASDPENGNSISCHRASDPEWDGGDPACVAIVPLRL